MDEYFIYLYIKRFICHLSFPIATNLFWTALPFSTVLNSQATIGSGSNFLAANLYARSVFGEDALVNVSVDRKEDGDGKLSGYIRIRSKTQGIALSLGDRITSVQRAAITPEVQKQ